MTNEFAVQPFDQTTVLMTTISTVFFLVMSGGLIYLWVRYGGSLMFRAGLLVGISICISGLVLPLLFAPKGIVITEDELVLQSPLLREHVPVPEIESVKPLVEGDMVGVIRTFGVGSLWGDYGYFENKRLGVFRKFTTSGKGNVLIKTKHRNYVVSPKDVERFVAILQDRIGAIQ